MNNPAKKNKALTKKRFEALLKKAAQPVSEWNKPAQAKKETSGNRPSGGYSGIRKSQDKTEGKEDSQNG